VPIVDLAQALLIERHYAEWFLAERDIPGVEVHHDADVTWVVHAGPAWRNAGIMLRFSAASAERRLDTLLARYQAHGRGMGLWVSPSATPANLSSLLRARGLRCQKHFPAMIRTLAGAGLPRRSASESDRAEARPRGTSAPALEIRRVSDTREYHDTPHPAIGPITTSLRRHALQRLHTLVSEDPGRIRAYVAWLKGTPVGAIELFLGSETAGLHNLSVLDAYKGRGIGSALVEHVCQEAVQTGAKTIALLASSEGQRLYERRGFAEVGRFGYWYRSFQRDR
jgi:GNAT superfamily N-acetyltransferase